MKWNILHENRGRIRLHLNKPRMSLAEADQLQDYLTNLPGVRTAAVYERTCDVVVVYTESRAGVIKGLTAFRFDVAALAEVIVAARRRGEDIGSDQVLARYQDWRRPDATVLAYGMDGVNTLFSNKSSVLRAARELGMWLVDAIPPLRRGFMRQAAGLSLDPMPRLLTGQRL